MTTAAVGAPCAVVCCTTYRFEGSKSTRHGGFDFLTLARGPASDLRLSVLEDDELTAQASRGHDSDRHGGQGIGHRFSYGETENQLRRRNDGDGVTEQLGLCKVLRLPARPMSSVRFDPI